jgi:hypothetical protein
VIEDVSADALKLGHEPFPALPIGALGEVGEGECHQLPAGESADVDAPGEAPGFEFVPGLIEIEHDGYNNPLAFPA